MINDGKGKKPIIMVSSVVYGNEQTLDRIYQLLDCYGYQVYMSYKGTIPINPKLNTVANCLEAVAACDCFLGIIFPQYGTTLGINDDISATHQEFFRAVELSKPCWFLVHENVTFARGLLAQLGYKSSEERKTLIKQFDRKAKGGPIDDLRLIDMYELANCKKMENGQIRVSWVQKIRSAEDILTHLSYNFDDIMRVQKILSENNGGKIIAKDIN